MARLNDFSVFNFSGGVRNDKSDFQLQKNELKDAVNIFVRDTGTLEKRRGSVQFGDSKSGDIVGSIVWKQITLGTGTTNHFIFAAGAATSTIYRMFGTRTTAAVSIGDSTISVSSATNFSSSGDVEIEGDIITYTGITGGVTLTGISGITSAHPSGSAVHQIGTISSSGADGRMGIYFAVLNNILFVNGRNGSHTWDGSTFSAVSDADEPGGLFAANYKDRIYVAGSGIGDSSGTRNGSPIRVSYSDTGDSTSWDINNFFDVESYNGDFITGLKEYKESLLIWKLDSVFLYNLASLNEVNVSVGAYNNYVIQNINGILYTFCPSGVYRGNGYSFERISDPIRSYIDSFIPQYDSVARRVIINTYAGVIDNNYWLYIGNITNPTHTGVTLIYDTKQNSWFPFTGVTTQATGIKHFGSFSSMPYGTGGSSGSINITTPKESLIFGTEGGTLFRMFSTRHRNSGGTIIGGDVLKDRITNTGTTISCYFETPLYDIQSPHIYKKFGFIQVFAERGFWHVSYRLEKRNGITGYNSLGTTKETNTYFTLPKDTEGYRIGLRFEESGSDNIPICNGFILGDIETSSTK